MGKPKTKQRKKTNESSDEEEEEEVELPDPAEVTDAWSVKLPKFSKKDNPQGVLCESSFTAFFPQYREIYIRECWPLVKKTLGDLGVLAELDAREGVMHVKTTRKMWDPYVILKARDMINLLSRSVPFEQAARVLEDDMAAEVIKIKSYVRNKVRFCKRRSRLIGPNGATLKAIELLTDCYIQVQGKTVAVIGPHRGLKQVRKIVIDTMKNIHPVYNIKAMMIKRELAKDPNMKEEDWSRFLPKYVRNGKVKTKQKKKKVVIKEYTPFPPPMPERKIDKLMASGEFFLTSQEKQEKIQQERAERSVRSKERRAERMEALFTPPEEPVYPAKKKHKPEKINIEAFKKKVKKAQERRPAIIDNL